MVVGLDGWMYAEHFEASSDVHTLNTRSKYHNRPTAIRKVLSKLASKFSTVCHLVSVAC